MNKKEFDDLVGEPIPDWQWEAVQRVYCEDDDNIPNVGGKEVIAKLYKEKGFDAIYDRFIELGYSAKQIINRHEETPFETYDVTYSCLVVNQRFKPLKDVYNWLRQKINTEHKDLMDELDYFSVYPPLSDEQNKPYPGDSRIAVFYVRGGSEGYYLHVESLTAEGHKLLMLGKTLCEGKYGQELMATLVGIISAYLEV